MECEKLPQALRCEYCQAVERSKFKFQEGETVCVTDGFAHIGTVTTIEATSGGFGHVISYRLKGLAGWWPQSSLEKVKPTNEYTKTDYNS